MRIGAGGYLALSGTNGAGKSTLRTLDALTRPRRAMKVNGVKFPRWKGHLRKARQRIGMIFNILT